MWLQKGVGKTYVFFHVSLRFRPISDKPDISYCYPIVSHEHPSLLMVEHPQNYRAMPKLFLFVGWGFSTSLNKIRLCVPFQMSDHVRPFRKTPSKLGVQMLGPRMPSRFSPWIRPRGPRERERYPLVTSPSAWYLASGNLAGYAGMKRDRALKVWQKAGSWRVKQENLCIIYTCKIHVYIEYIYIYTYIYIYIYIYKFFLYMCIVLTYGLYLYESCTLVPIVVFYICHVCVSFRILLRWIHQMCFFQFSKRKT